LKKGVIIQSGKKWAVVLTPDGEFCKVPSSPDYVEGKEISFQPSPSAVVPLHLWAHRRFRYVAVIASCLLIFAIIFPLFGNAQAYAAVTIDMAPSLELETDDQAKVIDVYSFNKEGAELIKQVDWKKKKVVNVTEEIMHIARLKGYLANDNRVLITTTVYDSDSKEQNDKFNQMMEAVTQNQNGITVVLLEGKKQWHEEAKKEGKSPGKYILVKKAEQQGIVLKGQDVENVNLHVLAPIKGVKVFQEGSKLEKDSIMENPPLNKSLPAHATPAKQGQENSPVKWKEEKPKNIGQMKKSEIKRQIEVVPSSTSSIHPNWDSHKKKQRQKWDEPQEDEHWKDDHQKSEHQKDEHHKDNEGHNGD
jgi:hypothetical protein